MRKSIMICFITLLSVMELCGCVQNVVPDGLKGSWQCEETASDGTTVTDFYALNIDSDGNFDLYDTVGNPGISGTLRAKEDHEEGILYVVCDEDDFDPPLCWDMELKDELEYEILENGGIRLGHNDIWLNFYARHVYETYQIRLTNRSTPEYNWEMELIGDGEVKVSTGRDEDEEVGYWGIYNLTGCKPGKLTVTMKYSNGKKVMYTVTFDLRVNEDGKIREIDIDGDIDEAMTT